MKPESACYFLQNKAYFFPPPDLQDAEVSTEPEPLATPFWCLKTHDAVGPDGLEACDEACGPDRPCYKPEVQL
jgi:hypothetical protein